MSVNLEKEPRAGTEASSFTCSMYSVALLTSPADKQPTYREAPVVLKLHKGAIIPLHHKGAVAVQIPLDHCLNRREGGPKDAMNTQDPSDPAGESPC